MFEQTDGCHLEGSLGGCVKKVKRLRGKIWQLHNSHGDVKYRQHREYSQECCNNYGLCQLRVVKSCEGDQFTNYLSVKH